MRQCLVKTLFIALLTVAMTAAWAQTMPSGVWDADCSQAAVPPTIDGVINPNEWMTDPVVFNQFTMFENPGTGSSGEHLGWFSVGVDDDADYSAKMYFMWDSQALYIAWDVTDDAVIPSRPAGDQYGGQDGFQFGLNARLNATITTGVYLFEGAPLRGSGGTYIDPQEGPWTALFDEAFQGGQNYPADCDPLPCVPDPSLWPRLNNVTVASSPTANGYQYELRLPWSDIEGAPAVVPSIGTVMGYLAMFIDEEPYGSVNELWWNAGSDVYSGEIGTPSLWNKLIFDGVTPVPPVEGTITSVPSVYGIVEGVTVTLNCFTESGTDFQWFKDGGALFDGGRFSGVNTDTLVIADVTLDDQGVYTCRFDNGETKTIVISPPFTLTVYTAGSVPVAGVVGLGLLAFAIGVGALVRHRKA